MRKISDLESFLEIKFDNPNLLKEAMTHRSYINENPDWPVSHNERLEYLGDAVLELAVTEFLFSRYPSYKEGQLTSLRAALVNFEMLSKVAKNINLGDYIFLSKGEAKDSGRARNVILANAVEALLGATYLDKGYAISKILVKKLIMVNLEDVIKKGLFRDPKSALQEIAQERLKITPVYRILKEEGPDHCRKFLVGVFFDKDNIATGGGLSKQEAEISAAKSALVKLTDNQVK